MIYLHIIESGAQEQHKEIKDDSTNSKVTHKRRKISSC